MARLPTPGGDNGSWGSILNDFLSQVHASDGTLKSDSVTSDAIAPNAVTSSAIAPNSVTNAALASNAVNAAIIADGSIVNSLIADGTIQEAKLAAAVQTKLNQTAPVTSVAGKTGVVTLTKTDVGLDQVDNTSDAAKNSATATLTNKTLTSPKINEIVDANGNILTSYSATASAANYLEIANNIAGFSPTISAAGASSTIHINMIPKGVSGRLNVNGINVPTISGTFTLTNKTIALGSNTITGTTADFNAALTDGDFATLAGTETLTNKTITSPKVNQLLDTNGATAFSIFTTASAVNYVQVQPSVAGTSVSLLAAGSDTNISLNLRTKGAGTVQANGVDVVTATGTQSLSNKTLTDPKVNSVNDTNGNTAITIGAIPNAVNHIYIDNQSAGNYPTIGADGSDSDIGIALAPKNNGPVNLFGNAPTIAAAGSYNGGNLNLNLKSQGTGAVQANGIPVTTSKMKYPLYTDPDRFEPFPQILCGGGNWVLASGDLPMTLFIPAVNMTVSNIITMGWNDSTQTGASACRVAIFRVDDINVWPADMTCIARSAHKADRWNGAVVDTAPIVDDGAASPNAISSVNLTAGQQYAVGFLSVGHTGSVKLSALGGFRKNTLLPHVGFFGNGGYTDMPVHLTGGWIEEWTFPWFALT